MPESEQFWELYWEMRLSALQNLGKRHAILAASRLIRKMAERPGRMARLLELGCGEGQIIGALVEGHAQVPGINQSVGIDYLATSIATCRKTYPQMHFIEANFTDPALLAGLGSFEMVLMVNALHEVFTSGYSQRLGEIDVPAAKLKAEQTLASAVNLIAPQGYLLLFDGLEMPGDPRQKVRLHFLNRQAREHFETFAREYRPFHIRFSECDGPQHVELTQRDFTRYITKSIFLGKALWKTERLESYQYFTQDEFRAAVARVGLEIRELRTLTVDEEKWNAQVEIETPGVRFPEEHILIIAQRS
jgi:SAM-dependent methyltransferase